MRKKILIVLSVMFVFGLFASAFALSGTSSAGGQTAASCCPLPKQNGAGTASTKKGDSCCDMADCCKDGKCSMGGDCCKDKDSCPMKKDQKTSSAQEMDMSKVVVVKSDGGDCCKPGADCCKGGTCCHKKG